MDTISVLGRLTEASMAYVSANLPDDSETLSPVSLAFDTPGLAGENSNDAGNIEIVSAITRQTRSIVFTTSEMKGQDGLIASLMAVYRYA
jgi:hypothetical protein